MSFGLAPTRAAYAGILICLAIGCFALFHPVLNYPFVHLDDPAYITENPHVTGGFTGVNVRWAFTSAYFSIWHPLTWLSYLADIELYGLQPAGFHVTNLLLHTLNVLLLFLFVDRVTGKPWRGAVVAALFAFHPLHVEPVVWISSRKDLLSTFFLLVALCTYARPRASWSWRQSAALLGAFAAGLMSKSILVTAPALLLCLDYWPLRRWPGTSPDSGPVTDGALGAEPPRAAGHTSGWRSLVLEKWPLWALSLLVCALTYSIMRSAGGVEVDRSLWDRMTITAVAYVQYLVRLVWPVGLAPFYPRPSTPISIPAALAAAAFLAAATAVAVRFARQMPYIIAGWFWFLIGLLPVIGLVGFGAHSMADRYAYLPNIGLFLAGVWLGSEWLARMGVSHRTSAGLAVLLVAALAARSRHQLGYWRGSEALFRHTVRVTRDNYVAHATLGSALLEQGRVAEAREHFQRALQIRPDHAKAHIGLGTAAARRNDPMRAIEHYREALRNDPRNAVLHGSLALLLQTAGMPDLAIEHCRQATELDPRSFQVRYHCGLVLARAGNHRDAVSEFECALRADPDSVEALCEMSTSLVYLGRAQDAVDQLRRAQRRGSATAEVHAVLGGALLASGQIDAAVAEFRAALAIRPDWAEVHNNLGVALAQSGKQHEAIDSYRAAIELDANVREVFYNLACALYATDRPAEAASAFRESLKRNPDAPAPLIGLAWILATDPALSDPREAIELSERACRLSEVPDPECLDVAAAALAAAGDFESAVKTAEQAIERARSIGRRNLPAIQHRLQLYRQGQPAPPP